MSDAGVLERSWKSPDLWSPLTPVIVNNVVFAASSGRAGPGTSIVAVLHALDPITGQSLWNSGRSMADSIQGGSLLVGNSQVYVVTKQRLVYAFGFPMDR